MASAQTTAARVGAEAGPRTVAVAGSKVRGLPVLIYMTVRHLHCKYYITYCPRCQIGVLTGAVLALCRWREPSSG